MVQSSVGLKKARLSQISSSVADDRRPDDRRDASGDWNGSFKVMLSTGPSVLKAGSDGSGGNTAASELPAIDVACSAAHICSMAMTKSKPAVAMEARETIMAWRGDELQSEWVPHVRQKAKVQKLHSSVVCFRPRFRRNPISPSGNPNHKSIEKIRRRKYQDEQDVLEGYMLHMQGKLMMNMWLDMICIC